MNYAQNCPDLTQELRLPLAQCPTMMVSNGLDEVRERVFTKPVNDTELQGIIRSQAAEIWEAK